MRFAYNENGKLCFTIQSSKCFNLISTLKIRWKRMRKSFHKLKWIIFFYYSCSPAWKIDNVMNKDFGRIQSCMSYSAIQTHISLLFLNSIIFPFAVILIFDKLVNKKISIETFFFCFGKIFLLFIEIRLVQNRRLQQNNTIILNLFVNCNKVIRNFISVKCKTAKTWYDFYAYMKFKKQNLCWTCFQLVDFIH